MARAYRQPSIVSGKSIQDILSMDSSTFNKLSLPELRKVVGRLVSAGNKRLRSFERAGESSPAVRYIEKSGGAFSTRGKSLNALRSEFIRAKTFLESKTGTRKGWEQVKKETVSGLKKRGIDISEQQFGDVWKAYEELKDISPEVATRGLKYNVLRDIADMVSDDNISAEDIALTLQRNLSKIYEEQAESRNEFSGVSEFFTID